MKKKFKTLPFAALMALSLLFLWTGCKKQENRKQERSLQEYLQGVWVIDTNTILSTNTIAFPLDDTIKFTNNTVYFSCGETVLNYTAHEESITIFATSGESHDYPVDRISDNQIRLYGYSPCHDYTQVVKNSVFNKIN